MKEFLWEVYYIYITPKILSSNFGWGVVSTFWSASDTESKKPKSQLWVGGLSLHFWSPSDTESKNLAPNIRYGGVTTLAQTTSSFQEVSPPRQRHLVLMTCYLLTIQVGNNKEFLWEAYYIYITQKILSSNFGWGVVLISKWHWVHKSSTLDGGLSLHFWSASDTESKNLSSQH